MAVLLALGSAAVFGGADFCGGLASRRVRVVAVLMVSQVVGLGVVAVAAPALGGTVTARDLGLGAVAGTFGLAGVALLYRGLAVGPMGVVAPITAVISAAVPVAVGLVAGERPSPLALAGVGAALAAVVLVARVPAASSHRIDPAGVALALGAGAGFGILFSVLDATSDDAGVWPLLGARAATAPLVVAAGLAAGVRWRRTDGSVVLAAVAGLGDMAGNVLFLLALRHGLLTLVAVITGLYPASTIVLARFVLGERMAGTQRAGLALAAGAVTLMAVG